MTFRITLAVLLLGWPAVGCGGEGNNEEVRVMTQNLYYGFDTGPLLSAAGAEEIPILAAQAFAQLLATNFPERAETLADEIARRKPHLVGLQEVALFRIQSPGDAVLGGTVPAESVVLDYLDILLSALAARGVPYKVAGKVQNVDVELPMVTGSDPFTFDDIRLTDFDVVLARADVETDQAVAANYEAKLFIPNLGLEVPRGYVVVRATLPGKLKIRFATTHLEDTPFPDIQISQARELAAALKPDDRPLVLVGDFNSPAGDGGTTKLLTAEDYIDCWKEALRKDEGSGWTWGHAADLRNSTPSFTQRLDLVLFESSHRPLLPFVGSVRVWGDELDERTASGLWPSDHAGVQATLWLRR